MIEHVRNPLLEYVGNDAHMWSEAIPNPPSRIVLIALITLSSRMFSSCGTILNKRESEEMKKLDLM